MTVFVKTADSIFFWRWAHRLKCRWNRGKTLQSAPKKGHPDASITIFKQGRYAIFREPV